MDSPQFCGQSCHVMHPEYTAYKISAHSHVDCVECHIGSGAKSYFEAKVNGTKQLVESASLQSTIPRRFESPVQNLRPAREICEGCHTPARFIGEKLLVKSTFADDEKNTETQTVVVLHLGGRDSLSHSPAFTACTWATSNTWPPIHAHHDSVGAEAERRRLGDGVCNCRCGAAFPRASARDGLHRLPQPRGAHLCDRGRRAQPAMAEGAISPDLPWVHKEGLALLKATTPRRTRRARRFPSNCSLLRCQHPEVLASESCARSSLPARNWSLLYSQNVFPYMKVTWGTHPNNIGHMSYPGCFRCHDGSHAAKNGTSITQDCAACHNLLAVDEAKPKVLADLGIQ
jgi:hypothetical protein